MNGRTGPIGYSDTGYSDTPATVTVFWLKKGSQRQRAFDITASTFQVI